MIVLAALFSPAQISIGRPGQIKLIFSFRDKNSGLYLDVGGASLDNGATLHSMDFKWGHNQSFLSKTHPEGYSLHNSPNIVINFLMFLRKKGGWAWHNPI